MRSANPYMSQMNSDGSIVNLPVIQGYVASDIDVASPSYYGFLDAEGNWYIMKAVVTGDVTAYTFAKGTSDYATNWTNRAALTYAVYNVVF
jgi:hypothetical protein